MVKQAGIVAWLGGIAALVALTLWSGAGAVGQAISSTGWGILLVVLVRAVTVAVAGAGWWLLFPAKVRPQLGTCLVLRFVREAINVLLPVAQVGGDVIGARLLTTHAVPGALAAASVVVDILIQAAAQFLFAALGLVILTALGADHALARSTAVGLAIAALLLTGFYFAQRRGGQRVLQSIVPRLAGDREWRVLGTIDAVYHNLAMIYAARSSLVASCIVHMAGWIVGAAEVWIVFAFMGHPIGIGEAVVIESLMHAVRGAAFAVPSALGAQEGALVLLCAAFAIPPEQAIALSLVKRAADLALGAPGLLAWQMLEWGRLLPSHRGSPVRAPAPARAPIDPRSRIGRAKG